MNFRKKEIFTLPNILTYIRILCVPFFIWILMDKSIPYNTYIAFGIFIFASLTDLIDGFIARYFNMVSDIGKITDPIADKLLQVSTLICFTILGKVPWIFPLIYCIKETYMVLGGSAIVKIFKSQYVLQSNLFGKGATCLNSLGVVLAFFKGEVNRAYDIAVIVILILGATFAVITAIIYTIQFFKFRKIELAEKKKAEQLALNGGEESESLQDKHTTNEGDILGEGNQTEELINEYIVKSEEVKAENASTNDENSANSAVAGENLEKGSLQTEVVGSDE